MFLQSSRSLWRPLRSFSTQSIPQQPNAIPSTTFKQSDNTLINLLKSEPRHYAVVDIANRSMLVTKNDTLIINRLKNVSLGDVLDLTKIRELGSKNYTIRGSPFITPSLFQIQATVLEHTKGGKHWIIKKKRRKRYKKKIGHRQLLTVLRIGEIVVL